MSPLAIPALNDNYIWLLRDAGGDALVVDPGAAAPVRAELARSGARLRAILLTHHHADHIGGAAELAAHTGARVYAPDDARIPIADVRVSDGQCIEPIAALQFQVLAVPGHTLSHVAYFGMGVLFCGDTLFSVGCGRLFEGTPAQMLASLDRLAALPDTTLVCCGHEYTVANCAFARNLDPHNADLAEREHDARTLRAQAAATLPSNLASERACNPFLRIDSPVLRAALGHPTRVERFAELRRRKDAFQAPVA